VAGRAVSDLRDYHAKRDPKRTPEPFGGRDGRGSPPRGPLGFAVQQHSARRLHWDLRLEIDGVLASWAIPKGPSLDPSDRRLAVRTEDHPMEYADFEGVIPAGNYGAGAMILWDRGRYETVDGQSPSEGLASGKLDLALAGEKLRGRFALVRTRGEDGKQWLLLYKGRASENGSIVDVAPASVLSGLTVDELGAGVRRDAEVDELATAAGAPKRDLDVSRLRPMLARSTAQPFSDPAWIFELKYDGARVLAGRRGDEVRLIARSGRDVTEIYPEVTRAIGHLPLSDFILDGEVAALAEDGRSSFERLQRRFTLSDLDAVARASVEVPVVLYAFDLLAAGGRDLREVPLLARKDLLACFVPSRGVVRLADYVVGEGRALYDAASEHELEGIVAKRAQSTYETGARSDAWRKVKRPRTARLVIVGYLPGRGTRATLGSLLLAGERDGELVYAGNVGSGLRDDEVAQLRAALDASRTSSPEFVSAPDPPVRGTVYARPELVCEVRFTETTSAGLLRQPVFLRNLPGVAPESCPLPGAPSAAAPEAEVDSSSAAESEPVPAPPRGRRGGDAPLQLTRTDKVFWPDEGYTKGDLLAYYEAVWPWLAPHLRDRPVVLTRYPDGITGKSFFQKNAPDYAPDWARHVEIEDTDYFVCNELRTLLYVINSGAIPLHVWSARLETLDRPDWLILDLDPKEAPFEHVVRIARHTHDLLADLGARHFVKTSGQAGLHVILPLDGTIDHGDAREVAEVLARVIASDLPDIATIARPIASRGDRVYLDYLQNGRGKLIVAPFSVRPRPGAPVSMPIEWSRVTRKLDPARFTIRTATAELERRGDPLRDVLDAPVDVEALLGALSDRLRR
jgi:bifunctional non-homologous end joining protein LigD